MRIWKGSRFINLAFVAVVLVVTSVWLGVDSDLAEVRARVKSRRALPSTPTMKYYSGNRFNGVILEIQGQTYIESYRTIRDSEEVVISAGRCDRDQETLTLRDTETGVERELLLLDDELLYREKFVSYKKTDLDWEEILGSECPYSVDGIHLGASLTEVESYWGTLEPEEDRLRMFRPIGSSERWIRTDSYGRVDLVGGSRLEKDNESLLSTNDVFAAALKLGTKREYKVYCSGGGPRGIRGTERILGDYDLLVVGLERESYERCYPEKFRTMEANNVAFENVEYLELSHRYLSNEDLNTKSPTI